MCKKWLSVLVFGLIFMAGNTSWAAGITFDFTDPKNVNNIGIFLDSMLEPIMGVASGVSGNVVFDPENKKAVSGKIVVAVDKIRMANQMMTKVLHSEEWLDAEKFPTVEFTFRKIISAGPMNEAPYEYEVAGSLGICRILLRGMAKRLQKIRNACEV